MGGTKKLFHTLSLPLQQLAWAERFRGIETRKKHTPQARLLALFYFREGGMRPTVRSKHRPLAVTALLTIHTRFAQALWTSTYQRRTSHGNLRGHAQECSRASQSPLTHNGHPRPTPLSEK